jgi:hypothetical protein
MNFKNLILAMSLTINVFGQPPKKEKEISNGDKILLQNFWNDFKTSLNTHDRKKLANICKFPFYCSPCIDDTTLKTNDKVTIKVSEKIFIENVYDYLFEKEIKKQFDKYKEFEAYFFSRAYDDKQKPIGFMFSFTIVAPSKKWEGLQGFIYLNKINGKYKITGIDTVP